MASINLFRILYSSHVRPSLSSLSLTSSRFSSSSPKQVCSTYIQLHSKSLARVGGLLSAANGCSSTWISEKLQNHVELSKNRNAFRTFCASSDLASKKCVPCNAKDLRPMNEEVATDFITKVPGWNLVNEEGKLKLSHTWTVKSFTKGLELFQAVANIAEAEGHHPDLHLVGWNNVTIQIWTHAVGGVTENDFILASKISGLDIAHLLRRKPAN